MQRTPRASNPIAALLCAALAHAALISFAHAQVTINTANETVSGDTDFLSSSFNSTPFRTALDSDIAVFAIKGDLVFPASQIILGSRPPQILAPKA